MQMNSQSEAYIYKHLSIPGGGFVTGFVFHPVDHKLLYCRTDIGGVYRFDFEQDQWISLVDQVIDPEMWKTYPLSIALDKQHPNRLYSMVGLKPDHGIAYSEDYGKNFVYYDAPIIDEVGNTATIHGNAPGRSTGERLVVDPFNSDILYMGTMENGLFVTYDRCQTWVPLNVGVNISFVAIDERGGMVDGKAKRIIVATNGQNSNEPYIRNDSVYISNDGGESFQVLKGQPKPVIGGPTDYPGYVAQKISMDGKYIYISYAAYNIGWSGWHTYGCDTGKCYDGALFRFQLDDEGHVIEAKDITPRHPNNPEYRDEEVPSRRIGYGMSGISCDINKEGRLICSTITAQPDVVYHSMDYGLSWKPIMMGLEIGELEFDVPYLRPECNGKRSWIHWMSDLQISPHNSNLAIFNTGAGVFMSKNLNNAIQGDPVTFKTTNAGMEETVHLNVYSPPSGEVKAIDIIGDYGGFLFEDLDQLPENSFADTDNNRWITCMNADYSDENPQRIVATARGNWTGETKGGLIITEDQGKHWKKLTSPKVSDTEINDAIALLAEPNVTAGWVALSADGESLVWSIGQPLNGNKVIASTDLGQHWFKVDFLDQNMNKITIHQEPIKVFSDRTVHHRFFAFADFEYGPRIFISDLSNRRFIELTIPEKFPIKRLAGIDSEQDIEIRGIPSEEGSFLFAMEEEGLWLLKYDEQHRTMDGRKLSQENDYIKRIGIGKPVVENGCQTLFTSGTINGVYGFYRSTDFGERWIRINDDEHQFGDIRSISGDPRVYGRIYVATGTRGLIYGDIKEA